MRVTIESGQRFVDALAELNRARREACTDQLEIRLLRSRCAAAAAALVKAKRDEPGMYIGVQSLGARDNECSTEQTPQHGRGQHRCRGCFVSA